MTDRVGEYDTLKYYIHWYMYNEEINDLYKRGGGGSLSLRVL
jgi:hypothetical protein